jgi:hypothetical protein
MQRRTLSFIPPPLRTPALPSLYTAWDFHISRIAIYEATLLTWERGFMFA